MARDLAPRSRWVAWGVLAGLIYGAAYGWFAWRLVGEGTWPLPVAGSAGVCAAIGAAFALRYYSKRPTETNLCTLLGMLLGTIPAIGVGILVLGPARKLEMYGLASFALLPVLAGLLVGCLLDRLSEGFLFTGRPDSGSAA